ncbi:alpha-E domain-containing protein [Neomegalonema perideroedes]|uniref:alpha-E domain-containing protein n=1 Tax=Neomegalonema perideroedes TaxID=217219 RepID=UPI00037EA73C|nr:alpha-E domain-containing protein [Neomegalonema perideroedes]
MLSRTAENLYWMTRYVERAENMARLVEMGARMSALPTSTGHRTEWESVLSAASAADSHAESYGEITRESAVEHILFDLKNPSSVISCFAAARHNARAMRTALTTEAWEAINDAWIKLRRVRAEEVQGERLIDFLGWIKSRGALFRGALDSTSLRDEGYDFMRLGFFVERVNNTARILDVKYYLLLPATEQVGGGVDHYQWTTVLRATSSLRSYHWVYRGEYRPAYIADFLILNKLSPRSLAHCYEMILQHLDSLERKHGRRFACHDLASISFGRLNGWTMEDIFQEGLHEFLSDFISRTNEVSAAIADAYWYGG